MSFWKKLARAIGKEVVTVSKDKGKWMAMSNVTFMGIQMFADYKAASSDQKKEARKNIKAMAVAKVAEKVVEKVTK